MLKGLLIFLFFTSFYATADTRLIKSIKEGKLADVINLLESGADPNIEDRSGYTVLMWASYRGHKEVVEVLLDSGAGSLIDRLFNKIGLF